MQRAWNPCCWTVVLVTASFSGASANDRNSAIDRLSRNAPNVRVMERPGRLRVTGSALARGPTAQASVDDFLERQVAMLAIPRNQLVLDSTTTLMNGRFDLHVYQQRRNDIPVLGSVTKFLTRNLPGHPLVLVASTAAPVTTDVEKPRLSADAAIAAVRKQYPDAKRFDPPQLAYWIQSPTKVPLVWHFYADNASPADFRRWHFFVDAITGRILERKPALYHTDITGRITGFRSPAPLPDYASNPPQELPVYGARVRSLENEIAYTDANGDFVLPHEGSDPTTIEIDLQGQWCTVANTAVGGPLLETSPVTPSTPADVVLNSSPGEFTTSQLNAITHTTTVHDFVKTLIDPADDRYDISMPTSVNRNDSCNAYYTPGVPSLNFFHAAGGCVNTAYESVVYHEYGHFVVDFSPGGFIATGDYHEGMADTLAELLVDDPCIAPDLHGEGSGCLRNGATAGRAYPCFGSTHFCGQVIAGAFWDLRNELIETEGPTGALDLARQFYIGQVFTGLHDIEPTVTVDLLTLDSVDGDWTDGTPHYPQICSAFATHGLPCPSPVQFDFPDGRPDLFAPGKPQSLRVTVTPNGGHAVPGTATLRYRIGTGPFQDSPMAETSSNQYEAAFPALACGDSIEYYFRTDAVLGDQGQIVTVTVPNTPTDPPYSALGADAADTVASFDFQFTAGWSVSNSPDLLAGQWQIGDPVGFDRGDPPTDFDGSGKCFLTDNHPTNENSDVDGGSTTLVSPPFDLSATLFPRVSYARWYSNSYGSAPYSDTFLVETSTDDGLTWSNLETVGPTGPEVEGGWYFQDRDLSPIASHASQLRIRFVASDLGDGSIIEAAVDAVSVYGLVCKSTCINNALCDDGDPCTRDVCRDGVCTNTPGVYGDLTGSGSGGTGCEPDGFVDVFDVLAVLNAFVNQATGECGAINADIAGPGNACAADGTVNIFDIFAVLDAFAGNSTCCPP